MSKNKLKEKQGYKGVEYNDTPMYQERSHNPFNIVGDAKPSKTGYSLAIRIRCSDGLIHDYTILKTELERIFLWNGEGDLIPASVREYLNKIEE